MNGFSRRSLLAAAVPLTALVFAPPAAHPAWAQEPPNNTLPPDEGGRVVTFVPVLAEMLRAPNLVWNAREQGVLLSVGLPLAAEPSLLQSAQGDKSLEPVPRANGFRLPDIAAWFDRRIVRAGGVVALSPTLTTVLATKLGKPDLFADLTRSAKLQRLEATFTPAQWRLIGSPNGLGVADLQPAQKSLFTSLLPDSVYVTHFKKQNGGLPGSITQSRDEITLTSAQRAGIRLTLYRSMDWTFGSPVRQTNIGISVGAAPVESEGTETLTLNDSRSGGGYNRHETTLYGERIKEVVPTRIKPTDLDYANPALDKPVALADVKTVGDLVDRIQKATRANVFSDPRYRDLTVFLRADGVPSTRAGDLLQGIAAAACGTFRRVSDGSRSAFVLTDDLEGLGTRQARIAEWAQSASTERQTADAAVYRALQKVAPGDYVSWSQADPMNPGQALSSRIEAFRTRKPPQKQNGDAISNEPTELFAPVSEMPEAAQTMIKAQIEWWEKRRLEQANEGNNSDQPQYPPLRTDAVRLSVRTSTEFFVPGVGRVKAGGDGRQLLDPLILSVAPAPTARSASAEREPISLPWMPENDKLRALLIPLPQTDSALDEAVQVAKARGFNQIWVELPIGETEKEWLTKTIERAKTAGLTVRASVRVTRRLATQNTDLPRDRNVLGETIGQWAIRRLASLSIEDSPTDFGPFSRKSELQNARLQKAQGDYLDDSDQAVQAAIWETVAGLLQTPGLAGVIVRDMAAPGSVNAPPNFYYGSGARSVAEELGYTPSQRLRFLLQNGVDPVDLSPLMNGQLPLPYGTMSGFGMPSPVGLPQMEDFGPGGFHGSANGVNTTILGSWPDWSDFRRQTADALWNRLRAEQAAKSPNKTLYREQEPPFRSLAGIILQSGWIGTQDKMAATPLSAAPVHNMPQTRGETSLEKARKKSSTIYLTLSLNPFAVMPLETMTGQGGALASRDADRQFMETLAAMLRAEQNGWDGVVIDLSAAPLETTLPLLRDPSSEPVPITLKPAAK